LAVYSPTRQSPSSVYATTSRDLPNPAVDTAVDAAVRQQPNFAQLVADVALLRVVVPVLGAQNSPMPSAEVALVVAAFLARPMVLALVRVPWLQGLGCVRSLALCSGSGRTGHRTMTLGRLGRSFDDSTPARPSPYVHRD